MLKMRSKFQFIFFAFINKQTFLFSVFKFNKAVSKILRVANSHITCKISKNIILIYRIVQDCTGFTGLYRIIQD